MVITKHSWFKLACVALFSLALFTMAIPANAQEATAATQKTTLDNLMTAYNGENNAHVRYLAFAKKADEEGHGEVASLFRAAAAAEKIHFERHAVGIEALGGKPSATIETPDVKSTKKNIEAAFKGESYERDVMYPEFLAQAEKEVIPDAVDAFEDAKAAEAVHAQLYEKALANLESMKMTKKDLYVCPRCGNVVETIAGPNCEICNTETTKFITVN